MATSLIEDWFSISFSSQGLVNIRTFFFAENTYKMIVGGKLEVYSYLSTKSNLFKTD